MKTGRWHGACLALVLAGCALPSVRPDRPLFNGRDLSGFYTWLVDTRQEDPRRVFTVMDRAIRISGDGLGYLATREEYENYRLRLEFKWGRTNTAWGGRTGKARDSGVFLHATGSDGNSFDGQGAFMAAIECNVFQGATGDFLLIRGHDHEPIHPRLRYRASHQADAEGWRGYDPRGEPRSLERWGRVNWLAKDPRWRGEFDFRGRADVEFPAGQWNELECRCEGDRIEIWLNGVKVNEAREVWPRRGKILLQCEGSEVFYRNIRLENR